MKFSSLGHRWTVRIMTREGSTRSLCTEWRVKVSTKITVTLDSIFQSIFNFLKGVDNSHDGRKSIATDKKMKKVMENLLKLSLKLSF